MIEQTLTAAHGEPVGIDLGSTLHSQKRYGENPKGAADEKTETNHIDANGNLNIDELRKLVKSNAEVKKTLEDAVEQLSKLLDQIDPEKQLNENSIMMLAASLMQR